MSFIHSTAMIKDNVTLGNPVHIGIRVELHNNCVVGDWSFING